MSKTMQDVKSNVEKVRTFAAVSSLPEVFRVKEENREEKEVRLQCAGKYARYGKKGDPSCS